MTNTLRISIAILILNCSVFKCSSPKFSWWETTAIIELAKAKEAERLADYFESIDYELRYLTPEAFGVICNASFDEPDMETILWKINESIKLFKTKDIFLQDELVRCVRSSIQQKKRAFYQRLISEIDVNWSGNGSFAPLLADAINLDDFEAVKLLLRRGANPHLIYGNMHKEYSSDEMISRIGDTCRTPFSRTHIPEMIKIMLEADPNVTVEYSGNIYNLRDASVLDADWFRKALPLGGLRLAAHDKGQRESKKYFIRKTSYQK